MIEPINLSTNSIFGLDYSLTHAAFVRVDFNTGEIKPKFVFHPKRMPEYAQPMKKVMDLGASFPLLEKVASEILKHTYEGDIIIAEVSPLAHFKSGVLQTYFTGWATGILSKELWNKRTLYLVQPADVRTAVGLKRTENKKIVQQWYLTNTNLKAKLKEHNEDTIDAAILCMWAYMDMTKKNEDTNDTI